MVLAQWEGQYSSGMAEAAWVVWITHHCIEYVSAKQTCPIFHLCCENFIVILRTSLTGLILILKYSFVNIFLSISCMFCRPLFASYNMPLQISPHKSSCWNLLNLFKIVFHSPSTVLENAKIFHGYICLYSWLKSSSITLVPSLRNIWLHGDSKFVIVVFT